MTSEYLSRGASSTKDDVHEAIKNRDKGIYPGAFCRIDKDLMDDDRFVNSIHADGAGTKSIVAYLQYMQSKDPAVFRGIAYDSIVMNIDDLLCIGASDNFFVSNTIGRNAHRINGKIISEIISGYHSFALSMRKSGINVILGGGETADVGDLVRTIIVDSTAFVRFPKSDVINCANIRPGSIIVGLSSSGKASYEDMENSSIGSNGFTLARHVLLSKKYKGMHETFSPTISPEKVYCGKYDLDDKLPNTSMTIGQALLSPTRTYAPVIKKLLSKNLRITGLIHNTGGGQAKCLNFGKGLMYVKDKLFEPPAIFKEIQKGGAVTDREMYMTFNMGSRMEAYLESKQDAQEVIKCSKEFGIDAQIIGRVEKSPDAKNHLSIIRDNKEIVRL